MQQMTTKDRTATQFVESSKVWFDAVWNSIARKYRT
jgi:hypothetical protein